MGQRGPELRGLEKLAEDRPRSRHQLTSFTDKAFRLGLATRSSSLGDPTDASAEGHPSNWVVGGPGREADFMIVVAADHAQHEAARVAELRRGSRPSALEVLHEDRGAKFDAIGSEHFGFQDGISQPGVRGRIADHEFLAYRLVESSITPDTWLYGLPGQLLVWPGEFVFGYPGASADPLVAGPIKRPGPGGAGTVRTSSTGGYDRTSRASGPGWRGGGAAAQRAGVRGLGRPPPRRGARRTLEERCAAAARARTQDDGAGCRPDGEQLVRLCEGRRDADLDRRWVDERPLAGSEGRSGRPPLPNGGPHPKGQLSRGPE